MLSIDTAYPAPMADFGAKIPSPEDILRVRKEMRLTQLEISVRLGIVLSTWRNYEKGRQQMPIGIWKGLLWERAQRLDELGLDDGST